MAFVISFIVLTLGVTSISFLFAEYQANKEDEKEFEKEKQFEYIVDITKPAEFPPMITYRSSLFSETETKASIERTRKWKEYIKRYWEELDKRKRQIKT